MPSLCSVLFLLAVVTQKCYLLPLSKPQTFSTSSDCDSTFYERSNTLFPSTLYKLNATNFQLCIWRIVASPDERIVLNITNPEIENVTSCNLGRIEIRDGQWSYSLRSGKSCGDSFLNPIVSTTNKLEIAYAHPIGYTGFLASYETICGEEKYIQGAVTLRSNNEQIYKSNKNCTWNIVAPENHQLVASFKKFELEYHEDCLYDYVEIYDSDSTFLGRFCGNNFPDNITSTSRRLSIKFVSDESIEGEGFSLLIVPTSDQCITKQHDCEHECINEFDSYRCACRSGYELDTDGTSCKILCGGILNASHGVINSPFYPEEYSKNKSCFWEIVAPVGHVINLNFIIVNLGENTVTCGRNKLEIFEAGNVPKLLGTYCGNVIPNPIQSESDSVKIVFYTDNTGSRFALNYSILEDRCDKFGGNCHHKCISLETERQCVCRENYITENNFDCQKGCHHEIASLSGTISSPNYPNYYNNKHNCTWKIKTIPGHKINLTFLNFETESCCDYVSIYDGLLSSAPRLAQLRGTRSGDFITSSGNELLVNFISDLSVTYRGFQGTYSSVCGGTWTATTTEKYIFSHDRYGLSNYYNNSHCVWIITPTIGYKTSLSIEALEIEQDRFCVFDFLEIYDGDVSLGKFCSGSELPSEFVSGNNFTIRFQTDNSINEKGFRLVYKAV